MGGRQTTRGTDALGKHKMHRSVGEASILRKSRRLPLSFGAKFQALLYPATFLWPAPKKAKPEQPGSLRHFFLSWLRVVPGLFTPRSQLGARALHLGYDFVRMIEQVFAGRG